MIHFDLLADIALTRINNPTAKVVFLAIARYANSNGECWPSRERLAHDACVSVRSVVTAIQYLEDEGHLRVEPRSGGSNIYIITSMEQDMPDEDDTRANSAHQVNSNSMSVRDLRKQIATKTFERAAIANIQTNPTEEQLQYTFKDPYLLDFLNLRNTYLEKDLEINQKNNNFSSSIKTLIMLSKCYFEIKSYLNCQKNIEKLIFIINNKVKKNEFEEILFEAKELNEKAEKQLKMENFIDNINSDMKQSILNNINKNENEKLFEIKIVLQKWVKIIEDKIE